MLWLRDTFGGPGCSHLTPNQLCKEQHFRHALTTMPCGHNQSTQPMQDSTLGAVKTISTQTIQEG